MMRKFLVSSALAISLSLGGCTGGKLDPTVVVADIKAACAILVPAADIAAIMNAAIGLSAQGIVALVCTGFTASQAAAPAAPASAQAKALAPGAEAVFPVVVNGKTITVHATKQ